MRYLILSDIHANVDALKAVLDHARGEWDSIVCCGDIVGYGPDPNAATEWTAANAAVVVRGNHDKGAVGLADLEDFSPNARAACLWTASVLTPGNVSWLRSLPRGPLDHAEFQIAHGSPADEDEYVMSLVEARPIFQLLKTGLLFFGHTHVQGAWVREERRYFAIQRPRADRERLDIQLQPDGVYLINPGSVGQPRDTDPRAAYAIFDSNSKVVQLRRCAYDHFAVLEKIRRAGLPTILGERLAVGR